MGKCMESKRKPRPREVQPTEMLIVVSIGAEWIRREKKDVREVGCRALSSPKVGGTSRVHTLG
jgi:hypothetical protein